MKIIDLSKQQALDADSKAIQQTNFTRNLNRDENVIQQYFLLLKKRKKPF